jgi:hypothetical protein
MLHIIGDSHSRIWSGKTFQQFNGESLFPNITVHHIGAPLAYNLIAGNTVGKWGRQVLDILKTSPNLSAIGLSFGEIDIRTQSFKRSKEEEIHLKYATEKIAERLIIFCKILRQHYCLPIFIISPIASGEKAENSVGSPFIRNLATLYFDNYLRNKHKDISNAYLITIFDDLVTPQLETQTQYYCDNVHINLDGLKLFQEKFAKESKKHDFKNYFL